MRDSFSDAKWGRISGEDVDRLLWYSVLEYLNVAQSDFAYAISKSHSVR